MAEIKTWEEELEAVELELAHLAWSVQRDQALMDSLEAKHQEICGEVGHDYDENWVACMNCGYLNPREYDEDND